MAENEPKRDCFAYRIIAGKYAECTALNAMYCRDNPNCHFYKKKEIKTNGEVLSEAGLHWAT